MTHVFISYVREDASTIDRLVSDLNSHGIEVWIDRNEISVGVRWVDAIRNAIKQGSFFLACFSRNYRAKTRTYMNEELTLAIEETRLRPTDITWFLPVLLDDSNIPDRYIGAGEYLTNIQYVSLYPDWSEGLNNILSVFNFNLGDRVSAVWDLNTETYYDGIVAEKPADWVFVKFDDGTSDFIPSNWVKNGSTDVGSRVEAAWWDNELYDGKIDIPPTDYEFIRFDDGDEAFIRKKYIKRI